MAISPFEAALNQICDEKGLSREMVIHAIEAALAAAYRKDYGNSRQVIRAKLNQEDISKSEMFQVLTVVKKGEIEDENREIESTPARKKQKGIKVGDELLIKLPQHADFGRIAAQTAKQVIIQRLQEAERETLYQEFKNKEGELMNGTIQQIEGNDIIVNLGRINGIMPSREQIPREKYYVGQRLKVYIVGVEESNRGPRILVSRSNPNLILKLFALEVIEIATGSVVIKGIAREAGSRSKVAVSTKQEGLDPVGSCVGQRGIRIQAVLAELGEEKIDIILWDEDSARYIANALSPAKIESVQIDKKKKQSRVMVKEDQLSLAIGKNGQNVRLASKLTGWSIDIEKMTDREKPDQDLQEDKKEIKNKGDKKKKKIKIPTLNEE